MLADRGSVEVVASGPHLVEEKYDGFRLQGHFDGKTVKLFSRGLEDHTANLQDIVSAFKAAVDGHPCIVDGEIIAYDRSSGNILPFQSIIRRKRKYGLKEIVKEMRAEYRVFDLLHLDGSDLTNLPLHERRKRLESLLKPSSAIQISRGIVTQDPEEALVFVHKAKEIGHEGGMLKDLSSSYLLGERDKAWTKLKPQTFDIDGVLVGGQLGTGKRSGMISRIFVAFPIPESESYEALDVAVGTGMSEEVMTELKTLLDTEGMSQPPESLHIDERTSSLVNIWIEPSRSPVIEIVTDSFSWKTLNNAPLSRENV
ncbi:MAG TPA: hypothetical protein VJ044_01385, partial [Candidatus Hodarchaeales archaeon]|nr:hypothetical protein [Candidatus Hodarchaeales archaeon]